MSMLLRRHRRRHWRLATPGRVVALLVALLVAIRTWPIQSAIVAILLASASLVWTVRRGRHWWFVHHSRHGDLPLTLRGYQQASPAQFEEYVADLYRRDGYRDVQVVGGANDRAADVLATHPSGHRGLTQCKRYAPGKKVDADTVYAVNGTYRDWHRCNHATIVTTSDFTASAREFAQRVGIQLVNGQELERWASRTGPAPWA